jgi:hypothetical protein
MTYAARIPLSTIGRGRLAQLNGDKFFKDRKEYKQYKWQINKKAENMSQPGSKRLIFQRQCFKGCR